MNDKEPRYPWSLFFAGLMINILSHIYLFVPGAAFLVVGLFLGKDFLKAIGLALMLAVLLVCLIDQIRIRNGVINSDDPNFEEWRNAMMSPHWRENITGMLDKKIQDEDNKIELENDDEDDEGNYPGDIGFML
ncbi:MAG: hypothetical protein IJX51_05850 [Clostridia bacterium]|nr:hypothetical protein [Clostridia bacterium]